MQDKIKISPYAPAKYEALKDYAKRHNIKWAFVRDFDEKLWYLNSGEWTDEMSKKAWRAVDELFQKEK